MIGLDTNVAVRILVGDDAGQVALAKSFLAQRSSEDPAFVSTVVLAEIAWVLDEVYGYPTADIARSLMSLFESSNLLIERETAMREAIVLAGQKNADVSDCIIARVALEEGAARTVTFDINAAKRIPGMELLK